MHGFEQACNNVCDIARGIQISFSINIPMPGDHKPTRLGGNPNPVENIKDYRSPDNGTAEYQENDMSDNKDQGDMSFIKPGMKPDKKDEEKKNERWN